METESTPEYDDLGHQIDPQTQEAIHRDVDPLIPTGICRYCA